MSDMSKFIHNSSQTAGFYRDRESAIAEGVAIKRNAAAIPDRPKETAQELRARRQVNTRSRVTLPVQVRT